MSYDELALLCNVFVSRLVSLAASRRHSKTPTSASLRTARPPSDHTPRANSSHAPLTPRRHRACRSTKAPTKNISARRVVLRSRLPNGLMRNVPPGRRSRTGDRRAACNEKKCKTAQLYHTCRSYVSAKPNVRGGAGWHPRPFGLFIFCCEKKDNHPSSARAPQAL